MAYFNYLSLPSLKGPAGMNRKGEKNVLILSNLCKL